ncbi:MAG TPA: DUF1206 domain-containing protein [Mycobacteriales bacterium]|nr:DUF1206 domain-containing protein [Mycobacteriales bacterium]
MSSQTQTAKRAAQEAEDSKPVEGLARFGLSGRGVIYVVVGLIALQVALGHGGRADRNGALAAVKAKPFGEVLLVVLAVAFVGYAAWRLLEAAVGHRDEDGGKRTLKRAGSLGRAVLYGSFAFTTIRFLATSSQGRDKTRPLTARVMEVTGGRVLVGLVGAALIGGGLYMCFRALTGKHLKRLALGSTSKPVRRFAATVGMVGLVSRGLLVGLVGAFLVQAAVTFDPKKAKGFDAALKSLADEPLGSVLIGVLALGLMCFGVWSFVEARYRRV